MDSAPLFLHPVKIERSALLAHITREQTFFRVVEENRRRNGRVQENARADRWKQERDLELVEEAKAKVTILSPKEVQVRARCPLLKVNIA